MGKRLRRSTLPKPFRIRYIISLAIAIGIIFGTFDWVHSFVVASPYFKIEKVEIVLIGRVPLSADTVRKLLNIHKGRSIFEVDLKSTRDYILLNYPEIKRVIINKVFPNKLVFTIRPRRPVAQVGLSSGFCLIDSEAVVLPGIRALSIDGLPIISGIDSRYILAKTGMKCNYTALMKALHLLEIIHQVKFSQDHEIHMLDVSDEKNLSFYIEGGIEIKIGTEDFKNRLLKLVKTFETGRLDKSQIKYIDLRFGNVIIGPR